MELDKDFITKVIESDSSGKKRKNKIPDELVPTIYILKTKFNITYAKIIEMLKKEKQISVTIPSVAYRVNKFGAQIAAKKEKGEILEQYPPLCNRPTDSIDNLKKTGETLAKENYRKNDNKIDQSAIAHLKKLQTELMDLESKRGTESETRQDKERRRELYELIRQEKANLI